MKAKYSPALFFMLLMLCSLFHSCKKSLFTAVKVTYSVTVKGKNTVTILCNNDYYYDTNNRKPIVWVSDSTTFTSNHYAFKPEDYYILVNYTDSTRAIEDNYIVAVYFNDTILAASSVNNHAVPSVELKGTVAIK